MSRSIRVAICGNDVWTTDRMELFFRKLEQECGAHFDISVYRNGQQLIHDLMHQFDIILLELVLPIRSGLEIARYIRKRDKQVLILFITAEESFIKEGYALNIFDCIVKPVRYSVFSESIRRAISCLQEVPKESIMIKNDHGLFRIYINEIRYIETYERKLKIHKGDESIICYRKMKELEELLIPYHFFRCHSGYLVNLAFVLEIVGCEVILSLEERIPVSQNRRSAMIRTMEALAEKVL